MCASDPVKTAPPPSSEPVTASNKFFKHASLKFGTDPDDPRGHLAFALFMYEHLGREETQIVEKLVSSIETLDDSLVSVVYYAASNRLLDEHFKRLLDKKIESDIRGDRFFHLLAGHFDMKFEAMRSNFVDKMNESNKAFLQFLDTQSFSRQIGVAFFATTLVAFCGILFVYAPAIIDAARDFLKIGH